jgi:hypothetical protein
VIHHDGRSPLEFIAAAKRAATAHDVRELDVVDVSLEPAVATGRVLSWSKDRGTHRPPRGLWWAIGTDDAVAVTTGDDATGGGGGGGGGEAVSRPLAVKRRAGDTDVGTLAGEATLLAEIGVGGVAGGHALPVTLRGGGVSPAVLLL